MDLTNLSDMFSGNDTLPDINTYDNLQNAGDYIDAQTGAWQNSLGHRNEVVPYGNESYYRDELKLGADIDPSQVFFTKTPLGNESYAYQTYLGNEKLKNWTADYGDKSFLDEFVEVAAPAGVSMIGGHILGGAIGAANPGATFFDNPITQKIFNQALTGAGMSTIQGGNPLTGAVQGAVGAAIPGYNVGGQVGIENPALQNIFNRGAVGGINSALGGGDALTGAVTAAAPSALGSLWDRFKPEEAMPDVGTLGGTVADSYGETSATLGGQRTPDQQAANFQALDTGQVPASMTQQLQGSAPAQTASSIPGVSSGQPPAWAQGLSGIFGIYSALDNMNRNRRLFKNLSGMYGANGSYAKQLRQKLERQDAARGRRSDYAGRQVQLDAALANGQMSMAPALAQIGSAQNQGLMSLFNNALKMGTNQDLGNWLGGLFKG